MAQDSFLDEIRSKAKKRVLYLPHAIDRMTQHVVCAPKDEYLAVITVYIPDSQRWEDGFRKRVQ